MQEGKHMARGGYRGGGRPPKPLEEKRKAITFTVAPETHEKLKSKASEAGMSIGRYIEHLLEQAP